MTSKPYVLWSLPHSLYSGKIRSYLIKRDLPFVERFPSDPDFATRVLPQVGLMVIPVLETPEGEIVQENCAMIDLLEERHGQGDLAGLGPVQQVVAEVIDAYGCNALLALSMHYRWSYRAEQEVFLRNEFARAIPRLATHTDRIDMAAKVMSRFNGFLPNLGVTEEVIPAIEAAYDELLTALEEHFQQWPYLLGGKPSLADFGLLAPLFAHLGRDPVPASLMKKKAPSVFRWTERMNTAVIPDPDYGHVGADFPAGDAIPETLEKVLTLIFAQWGPALAADAAQFDAWVASLADPAAGTLVSHNGERQVHPHVGRIEYQWRGVTMRRGSHPHSLWHFARAQNKAKALQGEDARGLEALLERTGGTAMMALTTTRPIARANNVLVLA